MKEEKLVCTVCGCELSENSAYVFNGEHYCEDCYDELFFVCDHCGEIGVREDSYSDRNQIICRDCCDNYYNICEDCGAIIRNEYVYYLDDIPYCEDCYYRNRSEQNEDIIHDYSYKPDPVFKGQGERFIGVELEVDRGGQSEENAEEVLDIANYDFEDNIYIKTDGSLDDGFEIVSHPMTLDYHLNQMSWRTILSELVSMGYKSHQAGTCGLHCHVNRNSLGEDREKQESAIARILYFVEHNWDKMLGFSRRTEAQMSRWAARYDIQQKPCIIKDHIKKNYFGRYRCINLTNRETIEFRLFRGTLKYNTFIATLQLVNEICNVAVLLSDEEMSELDWTSFLNRLDNEKNKELITYLKERHIYTKED